MRENRPRSLPGHVESSMASPARRYSFSVFTVDLRARKLWRGTTLVPLPARAFDALAYLIARPGRPIEKNEIIAAAWRDVAVTDDSLIHAISVLRRALGDEPTHPSIIETIPRFGYRFVGTVEPCADDGSWPPGSTPRAGAPRRSLNTIRLAAS